MVEMRGRETLPAESPLAMFRAIKWTRSSDDTTPVGPWRETRPEAVEDAQADYTPHGWACYEIQSTRGGRRELSEAQMVEARDRYHRTIKNRDAVGVWG
jgi:hypothetical protein